MTAPIGDETLVVDRDAQGEHRHDAEDRRGVRPHRAEAGVGLGARRARATASTRTATGSGPRRRPRRRRPRAGRRSASRARRCGRVLWRTARPASGLAARAARALGAHRLGARRLVDGPPRRRRSSSAQGELPGPRVVASRSSPARIDASNCSSWATQSASPSRHAGAGIAAHGSSLGALSRATTMGTWPVGASVQCGSSVAGSISGASSTRSAAISAPVIVTRESVAAHDRHLARRLVERASSSDFK